MGVLTIRNLDDKVIAALKARAKANHRSLEGELRHILSRHAAMDSGLGLLRERARLAYDSAAVDRPDATDSSAEAVSPPGAEPVEWMGMMRDTGKITGDIVSPVSDLFNWNEYRLDDRADEEGEETR